jgi:hypothetical protein
MACSRLVSSWWTLLMHVTTFIMNCSLDTRLGAAGFRFFWHTDNLSSSSSSSSDPVARPTYATYLMCSHFFPFLMLMLLANSVGLQYVGESVNLTGAAMWQNHPGYTGWVVGYFRGCGRAGRLRAFFFGKFLFFRRCFFFGTLYILSIRRTIL